MKNESDFSLMKEKKFEIEFEFLNFDLLLLEKMN